QPGQFISVAGSQSNDGLYQIGSVSSDGSTLILIPGEALADESNSTAAVNGPDTITRATGSWGTDGVQAGQVITVAGTQSNDGTYVVASVSTDGKVLTLRPLFDVVTGTPKLTFAPDAGGDTVSRSSGSWIADGFHPGQSITIAGTQHNNGTF